jgi:hypothetical protein
MVLTKACSTSTHSPASLQPTQTGNVNQKYLRISLFLFATIWELAPTLEHRADFSVSWSFTDGRTPWTGDQLVARPLPKHRTTQTQKNAHTHQTYMPWVEFEPTIPASERAKTVHALDRSATVTGTLRISLPEIHRKEQAYGFTLNCYNLYCLFSSFVVEI